MQAISMTINAQCKLNLLSGCLLLEKSPLWLFFRYYKTAMLESMGSTGTENKKIKMTISFVHLLPVCVLLSSINCPEPGWNVLSLECQLQQKVMMLMLTNQMQLRVL